MMSLENSLRPMTPGSGDPFRDKVAGRHMARPSVDQRGHFSPAPVDRQRTSRMKSAATRWIDRTRDVAGQSDPVRRLVRLGHRYRRQQGFGVGMLGIFVEFAFAGDLDQLAERSEEHTSELQSLMRISYAVFCLKKKT